MPNSENELYALTRTTPWNSERKPLSRLPRKTIKLILWCPIFFWFSLLRGEICSVEETRGVVFLCLIHRRMVGSGLGFWYPCLRREINHSVSWFHRARFSSRWMRILAWIGVWLRIPRATTKGDKRHGTSHDYRNTLWSYSIVKGQ